MSDLKTFSERLSYIIESKSLTAYQISVKTGIAESTLHRLISGQTKKIQANTCKTLADFLEINDEWLRSGEGDMLLNGKPGILEDPGENTSTPLERVLKSNEMLAESNRILAESNKQLVANNTKLLEMISKK